MASRRGALLPTCTPREVECAHIFRFVDGMITARWAVRDDLEMLPQLGAIPTPADTGA